MKKTIFFAFFLGFFTFTFAQTTAESKVEDVKVFEPKWEQDFDKAMALAKKKHKPLLIFFTGSDWCGPCKMLHKNFFETEEFTKLSDKKLVLYKADFPRRIDVLTPEMKQKNNELQMKYEVRGYPTMVLINPIDGTEINRQVGYSPAMGTDLHQQSIDEAISKVK